MKGGDRMKPLLKVDNLHLSFYLQKQEVKVLRGVQFQVQPGETVALVGESGCGKSLTARSIMGILPHIPHKIKEGSIEYKGRDLLKLPIREMERVRGKEIAMIFQDPMTSLNPTMKVGWQIAEGVMKHEGMKGKQAYNRAIELLSLCGIPEPETRAGQYPHEFSGGMRQRAMIAMALSCSPRLLIADEPTTALDVTIQAQIIELLKKIQQDTGTSILLITHDLGVVASLSDRVVVMYAGEIVEAGKAGEIFYAPRHPYTRGLIRSVPRVDQVKGGWVDAIPGAPPDLNRLPKGCVFASRCGDAMEKCFRQPPVLKGQGHVSACWVHTALQHQGSQGVVYRVRGKSHG
jgi:oligopeptide transport system ATP-binding protein